MVNILNGLNRIIGRQSSKPELQTEHIIMQPKYGPSELGIELVRGCNFACAMCPVTANEHLENEKFQFISLDLLRRIVSDIDNNPTIKYIFFFHFGEPMAHPDYEECLAVLNKSRVAQEAFVIQHTNGSLLKGRKSEAILDIPIIKKLSISFDGWGDKSSFERMRGPFFEKVVENAKRFAEAAAVKRPDLQLTTCSIIPKAGELGNVEVPHWDEAVEKLKALFADTQIVVEPRPLHDYNGDATLKLKGAPAQVIKGGCTFVENKSLYLTVNGYAQPCCAVYDESFNVGKFGIESISDLLNSNRMKRVRHNLRIDEREKHRHCSTCTISWNTYLDKEGLSEFWKRKIENGEVLDRIEIEYIKENIMIEHLGD